MIDYFNLLLPWHWYLLGLVLLILEVIGLAGFMLGVSAAAFITGIWLWLMPELHWHMQLLIFAGFGVGLSVAYWRWFKKFNLATDQPLLNNRAAYLIDQTFPLNTAIENERGRIQVGDTFWQVRCKAPLKAGDIVKVSDVDGMVLIVVPA